MTLRRRLVRAATAALCPLPVAAAVAAVDLEPIPEPNLDQIEAAVVEQLEGQRAEVERLATAPDAATADLAEAMGKLGQLYILYELLEAAEPAMLNAARLAPDDFRWHYFLGTIAQEQRRLREARAALERSLELEPGYLPALIRLGDLERAGGRAEAARRWYGRALEVAPASPAANWGLGQLAFGEGDARTAVQHFEEVLAVQPGATAVHYPLALALRDLGKMDAAREHLSQRGQVGVQHVDPLVDGLARLVTGASLYMVRGNRAFARGQIEIAVDAYRRAVEADPGNVVAREALASALSRSGDAEGAMEQIRWVIDNDHASAGTYYNLATILSIRGDHEASFANFERALELDPELVDAHYNLGLLLERSGRDAEAARRYRRVLELDPQDAPARIRLAGVLVRQSRLDAADEVLGEVLATDPDNAEALLTRGEMLQAGGRLDEALTTYARVAEDSEREELRARGHYAAGRLLLAADRPAEAVDELRRAVDIMPGVVEARLSLAAGLGQMRSYGEAAAEYERLVARRPEIEPAHFGRALSYLLDGRDAEATAAIADSLGRLGDDPRLRHLLARVLATSPDPEVRDGGRALEMARRLFEESQSLQHAETLAMALAETGRFEEAAELQSRIVAEARRQGGPAVAAQEARLAGYRRSQPVRAPWLEGG